MDENKKGIEMPEDFSSVNDKALSGLKTQIAKAFGVLQNKKGATAEDLEEMTALRDQMNLVKAEEATRAETQAMINEKAKELAAEMAAEKEAETQTIAEATGAVEPESTETVEVSDDSAPVAEVVGEIAPVEAEAAPAVTVESLAAALVAALGNSQPGTPAKVVRAPITTATRARSEKFDAAESGSNVTITAAAGIDTVEVGSRLDRLGLADAFSKKARMLPDQQGNGGRGALVAAIQTNVAKNDIRNVKDDLGLINAFASAHQMPQQGLVASGGWCAPSETIYDFVCDFEAMPEMLDLPTMTANRGGVRYPTSPLLGDVIDDINSGFTWTEADDIAAAAPGGPTKPCFTLPCPDFLETRLQAQGICLTVGNLVDAAYPELVSRYTDLLLTAHAHRMNGLRIAQIAAAPNSIAVSPTVTDLSATEAILAGIELQIACMRDEFFMGADFVLEVVLPRWVRTVIRRDLARRGGVAFSQVSNADIAAFFGEIGARVQFVSDWQTLRGQANPGCTALPTSVNALVYPAGAHTLLDGGSLDLGVVRDSTLNATNDHTALWTEEFWALISRCASLNVTIPICPNGSAGAYVTIDCPTS